MGTRPGAVTQPARRAPGAPRLGLLLLALVTGCGSVPPQPTPVPAAPPREANAGPLRALTAAREARAAGDERGFVSAVERADALAPGHPNLIYTLARAYAAAGDPAAALATLRRLAPFGDARDVGRDTAFAALHHHPAFQRVAAQLAANAAPLVRSNTAFVVPGPDLLPESIAHDPATGAWFLGSLVEPRVIRVAPGGEVADFVRADRPGRTIGIKVDATRRRLWAAVVEWDTTAPPAAYTGVRARTALHAYDLATGALLRRFEPGDGPHLFNDLDVALDGTVYVTDLNGHAVWRARWISERLERVDVPSPRFHWPNGIALAPDGDRLYVAHLEGISVVDVTSGARTPLPHPATVPLADTDGLYACRGFLVAVQRISGFEQVLRLDLAADGGSVTAAEVRERRHPAYVDPTTGVIAGDTLFYIANSQFRRLSPDGRSVAPASDPSGTVILRLPLGRLCR